MRYFTSSHTSLYIPPFDTQILYFKEYFMKDLISSTIEVDHKPFGSKRIIERENSTGNTKHMSKKVLINKVPVIVTSLNNGTEINIRCCPLKVLQGHNVFGTNSLSKLFPRIIVEVLNQLGIEPTAEQLREWRRGEFQVNEIHLTHRFPVESYSTVLKVISHILRYTSISMLPTPIRKGVGVALRTPNVEWLIYDKHLEFADKRTKEQKYLEAVAGVHAEEAKLLLLKLSSKSIRAELKLDKDYLVGNGLDRGKNWTASKVIEVFVRELGLLHLGDLPALTQMPEVYAGVADVKLRDVLMLWGSGKDMSTHVGKTTRERYRREIKKLLGIDILKDQPTLEPASINLSDIFDTQKMLTGFPKWSRDYPELALR